MEKKTYKILSGNFFDRDLGKRIATGQEVEFTEAEAKTFGLKNLQDLAAVNAEAKAEAEAAEAEAKAATAAKGAKK